MLHTTPALPPTVRVIVRDWLNANHVLLQGRERNVLVDSGYVTHADTTLELVAQALNGQPLHELVNTHCHSDHMGGNAALQRRYACHTVIPAPEAPLVERWDTRALWLDWAGQRAEPFRVDATVAAGDVLDMGELQWQAVAAPGHDDGALMFFCEEAGVLISGDALWEQGFGIVLPDPPGGLERARATLDTIARLAVRLVIPGHGRPFAAVGAALDRSYKRLAALEADPARLARSALRAMLSFTLLRDGELSEDELISLLAGVEFYREYDARFFRLGPGALAKMLITDLEKAGVLKRQDQRLVAVNR